MTAVKIVYSSEPSIELTMTALKIVYSSVAEAVAEANHKL